MPTRRNLIAGIVASGVAATFVGYRLSSALMPEDDPLPPGSPSSGGAKRIGGNIGTSDYQPNPYVDQVKSSRGFGAPGTYAEGGLVLDANGFPTTASRIMIHVPSGDLTTPTPTGVYKGTYTDNGSTTMLAGANTNCSVANTVRSGNTVTFDLTVTAEYNLYLDFSAGITHLSIITSGYPTTAAPLLKTEALNYFKQFHELRGMDFMNTNSQADTTWASRQPAGKAWGLNSWEALFAFATAVYEAPGSKLQSLWINVPISSDANYINQLAALAFVSLPSGLNLRVEYSNEIWNFAFPQGGALLARANNPSDPDYAQINTPSTSDKYDRMKRLWGLQFARIARAFIAVFGSRASPVLAGQFTYYQGWTAPILSWLARAPQVAAFGAIGTYCRALAAAPYADASDAQFAGCSTGAQVVAGLTTGFDSSMASLVSSGAFTAYAKGARKYGIAEVVAYEWGPGTASEASAATQNVEYLAHIDPSMQTFVEALGQAAWNAGWTCLNYYRVDPNVWSNNAVNSLWPAAQNYSDKSYKLLGLQALMARAGQ